MATNSGTEEYAKDTSRYVTKKKIPVVNSEVKRYPLFSVVSKMQIKSTAHILSIGKHKSLAIPNVGRSADLKKYLKHVTTGSVIWDNHVKG